MQLSPPLDYEDRILDFNEKTDFETELFEYQER